MIIVAIEKAFLNNVGFGDLSRIILYVDEKYFKSFSNTAEKNYFQL